ncbi:MAG: M14 family metallopeptidase, partial [Acidimicrobiia bacterium]
MQRSIRWGAAVLALAAGAGLAAPTGRAAGDAGSTGPALDLYRITAPPAAVDRLERDGFDVAASRADGTTEMVLGPGELSRLTAAGFRPTRWRDGHGRSVADLARAQAAGTGHLVWKRWDGPNGLRAEMEALAAAHPNLVQTEVIGHSVHGREIVAARVTGGAPGVPDGARPAVLYIGLQHAREWISGEVPRRLLRSLVTGYGVDPDTTKLLDTTELWFLPVANPDGYELTFEPSRRLWRKNVADNNHDGKVGVEDGVDINRNLPDHWAFAPMGSSHVPADLTYRGPAAASEPETKALVALGTRLRFRFIVNYHAFGKLLLYPIGWQEQTPTADQPIYTALAGTPVNPGIPGYKPQLSADLYPTNGETMSWAHANTGTLAFTVELGEGAPGSTFAFPDNEALVEQEYQLNRPFALDVARSAVDPTNPVSHLGNTVPSFTVDSFPVSYGDPQPVQATVLRRLGPVTFHWQVGDGPKRQAPAVEWAGGLRYGGTGSVYAHRVRGAVTGTRPGDSVKVWFTAGGETSEPFTYRVEPHRGSKLLVVIGGDHRPPAESLPGPAAPVDRLSPVRAALAANGVEADTYDVDAHGRVAPDPLGVLGHYEAVVWSTNEEQRTDSVAIVPGSVSRLANQEMLAARSFLNEGGRLLYMGRDAGRPYAEGARYDPVADGPCVPEPPGPGVASDGSETGHGCVYLSDEFFQYWLGAYEQGSAGRSTTGQVSMVDGVRVPFDGLSWSFADSGIAPGRNAAAYSATAETIGSAYPAVSGRTAAQYRGIRPDPSGPARNATAAESETPWSILFGFGFE